VNPDSVWVIEKGRTNAWPSTRQAIADVLGLDAIAFEHDPARLSPNSFRDLVLRERKARGLLPSELADQAGITRSVMSNLETGYSDASPETRRALLYALGVTGSESRRAAQ